MFNHKWLHEKYCGDAFVSGEFDELTVSDVEQFMHNLY